MTFWSYISRSTLKREAASLLMLWFMGLTVYLFSQDRISMEQYQMWSALVLPIFGLFATAFTLDWVSKQTNIAGPPSSGEAVIKTETTDTMTKVSATTEVKNE